MRFMRLTSASARATRSVARLPPPPPMFTANGVLVPVAPVAMPLKTPLGSRTTTRPTVIWPVNFWPAWLSAEDCT